MIYPMGKGNICITVHAQRQFLQVLKRLWFAGVEAEIA